ncbi:energy-coupling factor transporter ATPase [Pelotomaculum isophthalicicum JI]|uniref:ABC transporter ATP-binding protein n=1 Tax=Pelotomaculum isophthalicicum JI TaxID=947010 RepID=A0A9X4JV33_9FIRM|nr:energy-coupling factor transporter ATPase [Pelotomaculum isophthalicicum]MDF9407571.1 energy-coupling factor transporter ATPase [Pelotomaculum isophthalicicum JI]
MYNRGGLSEQVALAGVDLDVRKGEFLALVGPNGSGKSTLARHFNALLTPSEGTVLVDGMDTREPDKIWDIRQRVGMVFQNPDNQIVSSLVEEDVAFGAENLGLPPAEVRARVNEALALTGLSEYRNHAPHLLSGGQKQRLAIAGVLAMRPDCLVLDEPSSMLDPAGRRELMDILTRLNRSRGVTVVLVTHYMEEAVVADKVMLMSSGRSVLVGPPSEVFADEQLLQSVGLELPVAAKIAHRLRRRGFLVPGDILTVKDMVSYLCR